MSLNYDKYTCTAYLDFVKEVKDFLLSIHSNIESALLYGSYSRDEIIPGLSDIDLLVVINQNYVTYDLANKLASNLIKLQLKYGIKIHFRIRNTTDINFPLSGMKDSGITSFINKLRDGFLLIGDPIDELYLKKIQSASLFEIKTNIVYRLSDIKYQLRSLLTSIDRLSNNKNYLYKLGSLMLEFSELICYSYGCHFTNRGDSIKRASRLLDISWIEDAMEIKTRKKLIDDLLYFPLIEEGIARCIYHLDIANLSSLKKITISNVDVKEYGNLNAKDQIFYGLFKQVKCPEINTEGDLIIKKLNIQ